MPAVPGMQPPVQALCLAPFGMEEGTEAALLGARVRPRRRRAGALPLLRLVGAPPGPGRHPARRLGARRTAGTRRDPDDAAERRPRRRRSGARAPACARHRGRNTRTRGRYHTTDRSAGKWNSTCAPARATDSCVVVPRPRWAAGAPQHHEQAAGHDVRRARLPGLWVEEARSRYRAAPRILDATVPALETGLMKACRQAPCQQQALASFSRRRRRSSARLTGATPEGKPGGR
jgi:hypothetical protein